MSFELTMRQERVLGSLLDVRRAFSMGKVGAEWVIVSVCTTLESASMELLDELLTSRAASTYSLLERNLINGQKKEMNSTWNSRLKWLSTAFARTLDGDLSNDMMALVELRNAIVHRGRAFTDRQVSNYDEILRLRNTLQRSFGVVCRGIDFSISHETGDTALRIGRDVTIALLK